MAANTKNCNVSPRWSYFKTTWPAHTQFIIYLFYFPIIQLFTDNSSVWIPKLIVVQENCEEAEDAGTSDGATDKKEGDMPSMLEEEPEDVFPIVLKSIATPIKGGTISFYS